MSGSERAEARTFLLAEQDLIEHVEPVERDAGLAILGLYFARRKSSFKINILLLY
jgi:hypothetical protein